MGEEAGLSIATKLIDVHIKVCKLGQVFLHDSRNRLLDIVLIIFVEIFKCQLDIAKFWGLRQLDHEVGGVLEAADFAVEVAEIFLEVLLGALEDLVAVMEDDDAVEDAEDVAGGLVDGGDDGHTSPCLCF